MPCAQRLPLPSLRASRARLVADLRPSPTRLEPSEPAGEYLPTRASPSWITVHSRPAHSVEFTVWRTALGDVHSADTTVGSAAVISPVAVDIWHNCSTDATATRSLIS
ncbi:hypothetical protein R1CP_39220 (plasmid) [Rhodococcus opacus]|uniref:Uncharacterized protein n=1 Tax=Rhodococcus opacus TaxID=37919 RepID=A0A1B1KIK7_RHOOP|nr:hypothetical protein R1CP_39220 [Rhodococcus opacus]